ncbi:hypothetical protein Tco_1452445 [Tanacetum coccineum]
MLPTGTYAFKRVSHPLSPKEGVFDNDSDEEEVLDMVSVTYVGDGQIKFMVLGGIEQMSLLKHAPTV